MDVHEDRPVFHLYDPNGWVNDPNGPLYYKGQYHMFFQNVNDSTKWTWGLGWAHATSTDLLHWKQLPVALVPDPGWHDADGCFSGCATVDCDGVPAILYTGVHKKPGASEREGMPLTVNKLCWERQLIARPANPDDPDLQEWVKDPEPFIYDHMSGLPVNCFRDPFVLEKPNAANGYRWRIMVGSNIDMADLAAAAAAEPAADEPPLSAEAQQEREQLRRAAAALQAAGWLGSNEGLSGGRTLGTATVYRSKTKDLESEWEYEGLLCVAEPGEGAIWECPVLAPLSLTPTTAAVEAAAPTSTAPAPDAASTGAPEPKGAVAAAAATVADVVRNQQQQQQVEAERAMSGCLGLWEGSENSSTAVRGGTSADMAEQQQQLHQQALGPTHMFSVSAGVCPAIYWLGRYANGKFDLETADGPHALDLGDVVYAPNLLEDPQGRQIIWSWLQEHPSPISHDYSGCISVPRQLQLGMKKRHRNRIKSRSVSSFNSSLPPGVISPSSTQLHLHQQQQHEGSMKVQQQGLQDHNTHSQQQQLQHESDSGDDESDIETEFYLVQTPLQELEQLRSGRGLRLRGVHLPPGKPWSVPSQVSASHLDLTLTVRPTPGAQRFQLLLGPLRQEYEQQQQQQQQSELPVWTSLDLTGSAALSQADSGPPPAAAAAGAVATTATAGQQGPTTASCTANGSTSTTAAAAVAPAGGLSFVPIGGTTAADAAAALAASSPVAAAAAAANNILSGSLLPPPPARILTTTAAASAAGTAGNSGRNSRVTGLDSPEAVGLNVVPSVLPLLHSTAAAAGAGGSNALHTAPSSTGHSPFESLTTQQDASAAAGAAFAPAAAALPAESEQDLSEDSHIAAMAAAAAAAEIEQQHHQAAAITYEFGTAQVQVLVGPPAPLLKLLKQQQQALATAARAAETLDRSGGAHQISRTAYPTADKIGFEPPILPPAPSGALAESIAAAEAAGVRVLACQLRELDPDEPLQMRLLLDYSIMELFVGTGEVLTTRVYRGAPTARAKEVALKKAMAHAASEALASEYLEVASMDGSLANLGLVVHSHNHNHMLLRTGSGRLLGAHSSSCLYQAQPGSPRLAGWPGLHGVSGFSSPAVGSPRLAGGSPRLPGLSIRPPPLMVAETPDSLTPGQEILAAELPNSPSELSHQAAAQAHREGLGLVSTAAALPALPFSPSTAATGSYVHYFSPRRSLTARVGWGTRHVVSLPTLSGISEMPAELAPASVAEQDREKISAEEGARISEAAAKLFGLAGSSHGRGRGEAAAHAGDKQQQQQQLPSGMAAASSSSTEPAAALAESSAGGHASSETYGTSSVTSEAATSDVTIPEPELEKHSFPGFSPHQPLQQKPQVSAVMRKSSSSDRASELAAAAAAAGTGVAGGGTDGHGSSSTTGAKLASWFTNKLAGRKSSGKVKASKASKAVGSSITRKVIVPAIFGQPVPPQLGLDTAAAVAAIASTEAAIASDIELETYRTSDGNDSVVKDQQQQQQYDEGKGSHKAAAGSSTSMRTTGAAAAPQSAGVPKPPRLSIKTDMQHAGVAAASSTTAVPEATTGSSAQQQQQQQQQRRGMSPLPTSPTKPSSGGSGASSPAATAVGKSPRRNWRAAFAFTESGSESDDEQPAATASAEGPGAGSSSSGGARGKARLLGEMRGKLAAAQAQLALQEEYGLYAKVFVTGSHNTVSARSAKGDTQGEATQSAAAADAGKKMSSGYMPGAMRELSLVVLGEGGVMLRLEAYEMASMWNESDFKQAEV